MVEQIRKGLMHFPSDDRYAIEGILKVRYLPNKRIDFLSVDESARLQANMMADMMMQDMSELIPKDDIKASIDEEINKHNE